MDWCCSIRKRTWCDPQLFGPTNGVQTYPFENLCLTLLHPEQRGDQKARRRSDGLLTIARAQCRSRFLVFMGMAHAELLGAPARAAEAFAPLLFGLLMDRMGLSLLLFSASLYIAALTALMCVRPSRAEMTE